MNTNDVSVHLQDFPLMDGFGVDQNLVDSMDIVRAICGTILSIRDKNNLRVRLPLNKMTIIARDADRIKDFSSIILDEVNIKNIEFLTDIENYGEKKLTLNFSKVGAKIGAKMQSVVAASKNNKWTLNKNNKLEIEGFELNDDEYTISWVSKNDMVFVVTGYDVLILLDLNITPELEREGMARDIVRMVQQYRKEATLDVSDKIELFLVTNDNFTKESIETYKNYIQYQTLAAKLTVKSNKNNGEFNFEENLGEQGILQISFNKIK
jgi:isoleucyl-tRNA synthetase